MPAPKKGPRLGGSPSHQRKMLSNLAASLIEEEEITTTVARAKLLRPYVEKMITKARRGDLHARRLVLRKIQDTEVVTKLFDEIGPRYEASSRWLHPHHQARSSSGRRCRDGDHRAGLSIGFTAARGQQAGPLRVAASV